MTFLRRAKILHACQRVSLQKILLLKFFSSTEEGKNVPPEARNVLIPLRPHHLQPPTDHTTYNHPNNRFSCKTNKTSKKHSLTEAENPKHHHNEVIKIFN